MTVNPSIGFARFLKNIVIQLLVYVTLNHRYHGDIIITLICLPKVMQPRGSLEWPDRFLGAGRYRL